MEISRKWRFSCLLLGLFFLATTLQGVQGEVELEGPSESECRPYIEKALKELETVETEPTDRGIFLNGGDVRIEETTNDSEHDTSAETHDPEQSDSIETHEKYENTLAVEIEQNKETEESKEGAVEELHENNVEDSKQVTESQEQEVDKFEMQQDEEALAQSGDKPVDNAVADEPVKNIDTESQEVALESQKGAIDSQELTVGSQESAFDSQENASEVQNNEFQESTIEPQETADELQQASAESQQAAAKLQETASESLEAAAESQETAAESQEATAESQEATAESQEATAESQEATAESQEAVAESQEAVAESQEATTESQETAAESQEAAVESQEAATESQETAAESQEAAIKSQESINKNDEELAAETEIIDESQETKEVLESQDAGIESEETATESQETAAESQEDAIKSKETAAESQETAAEYQETAAESKETTVEIQETAAEPSGAVSESQETAEVGSQENVVGSQELFENVSSESEISSKTKDSKSIETEEENAVVAESLDKSDSLKATEDVSASKEIADKPASDEQTETESAKEEDAEAEGKDRSHIVEPSADIVEKGTIEVEVENVPTKETVKEEVPEEELINEIEIPENLRPRDHIDQLLKVDDSNSESESVVNRVSEVTLKELKRLYEDAIKPLETLYKYRDLSNRHFGDSEIFSKPLVVFMGPWSGGKSSLINYLLDNEYNTTSLRTGAEPSPAYFNLLMHGDEPEVLDGTQLAADFTFAGLQKFGQGLEERLKGLKLPNKLLEKINIVEIPGILEVRKQVSRVFPFNDACQWFIDRADIIFLVYDPSKLDVGPETEAILDQLKGREHQTRIILNKADQVKPEELMRVQGALIWNISPLMSSAQPPIMYTTSLWSRPYETWAPVRLLQAQERAFLRDLRSAVDKRIENKISSARRFAVRVRNHAKMVDCYLTTYYNHKSVFGNRKQVSDQIIEHPQDYHIYEGLSTLTNISRYDLPDPDVYRDFFRLNPLYDFQQLAATCTYFRGCPINRLDIAIAYDFPEMVGKHKKLIEAATAEIKTES